MIFCWSLHGKENESLPNIYFMEEKSIDGNTWFFLAARIGNRKHSGWPLFTIGAVRMYSSINMTVHVYLVLYSEQGCYLSSLLL